MKKYRDKIDKIDQKIITLLAKRIKLAISIIKYKEKNNLDINQFDREKTMMDYRNKIANKFNVNTNFINKLFKLIIEESKNIQNKYLKK